MIVHELTRCACGNCYVGERCPACSTRRPAGERLGDMLSRCDDRFQEIPEAERADCARFLIGWAIGLASRYLSMKEIAKLLGIE